MALPRALSSIADIHQPSLKSEPPSRYTSNPLRAVSLGNGRVVVVASTSATGHEPFLVDSSGAKLLRDINPLRSSSTRTQVVSCREPGALRRVREDQR